MHLAEKRGEGPACGRGVGWGRGSRAGLRAGLSGQRVQGPRLRGTPGSGCTRRASGYKPSPALAGRWAHEGPGAAHSLSPGAESPQGSATHPPRGLAFAVSAAGVAPPQQDSCK